jgi:hypothetical protein
MSCSLMGSILQFVSYAHLCTVNSFEKKSQSYVFTWCKVEAEVAQLLGYGLEDRTSIPGRVRNVSLRHNVHTGSLAHPDPYPMGTGDPFQG